MTLISKLKSMLGLDGGRRDETGGTTVRVEREPRTETTRDVEEPSGPSSSSPEPSTTADTGVDTAVDTSVEAAVEEAEADAGRTGGDEPVDSLSGIGPAYAERLSEAGVETVGDLAAADAADLDAATDIGEGRLASWIEQARNA